MQGLPRFTLGASAVPSEAAFLARLAVTITRPGVPLAPSAVTQVMRDTLDRILRLPTGRAAPAAGGGRPAGGGGGGGYAASAKQREYIRSLGGDPGALRSREDASAMIEKLLASRAAARAAGRVLIPIPK